VVTSNTPEGVGVSIVRSDRLASPHGPERRRCPSPGIPQVSGAVPGGRVQDWKRKAMLASGIRQTLEASRDTAHPEHPAKELPFEGRVRLSALQFALEALLWAEVAAPRGVAMWCVRVAIQAVRLAAWVVWYRRPREAT
jgi:hypothetical protein